MPEVGGEHADGHIDDGRFDEVVDIVCAGTGPGVLAYAIVCADLDRSVLLIESQPISEIADPDTVAYLRSMTDDLGSAPPDLELHVTRAMPIPVVAPAAGARPKIEPFFGGQLRNWSATCSTSPFGVVCSQVLDTAMTAWRTKAGEAIRAVVLGTYRHDADGPGLVDWLNERALELGVEPEAGSLERLIFENGQVVGVVFSSPSGSHSVRASEGVAFCLGAAVSADSRPLPDGGNLQVALVGRTAGRFGRVELLEQD